MSYDDRHGNRIVRLNTLILVGLVLSACCVCWWAESNASLVMSIIRPVDVPEPYYTAQQNDSLGLNDLGVSLRDLKMPHKYERGVFDCSEKAAYVEWFLANRGFNVSIYEGNLYEGYRHSWVVVTINDMQVMIETAENSTNSFVCGRLGSLSSSCRMVVISHNLIQMLPFQSHQSCTLISLRRLKTMGTNTIGGL